MNNITQVIGWKFNNQEGMTVENGAIIEFPGGIPSQEAQDLWTVGYEKHLADTTYIGKREKAYLPVEEQLAMIYRDRVNNTSKWADHRAKVERDHPKPDTL